MRNIIKAVIVVGSLAAAITGTTVAVKKNKKVASWYEKFMPAMGKKFCKATETKAVEPVVGEAKRSFKTIKLAMFIVGSSVSAAVATGKKSFQEARAAK